METARKSINSVAVTRDGPIDFGSAYHGTIDAVPPHSNTIPHRYPPFTVSEIRQIPPDELRFEVDRQRL